MIKRQPGNSLFFILPGPICTALLLHLTFSFSRLGPCIWFAFIPLCWSVRTHGSRRAFIQGVIAGGAFYYLNLFWITNSIRNFSDLPIPIALLVMALLAIYLSFYFGFFSFLLANNPLTSWFSILFLASCWTLLEWLRGVLFVGFPWNNLGTALSSGSPFTLLLPYGGVYSLSFLIIYANLAFYSLIFNQDNYPFIMRRIATLLAVPALYLLLLAGSHAGVDTLNKSFPIKISIIQPNIPQGEKWNPAYRQQNFTILEQLSLETSETSTSEMPHLVIWPEASLPDFFQDAPLFRDRISTLTRQGNFYLLAGSPQYDTDSKGKHHYFNSALLFSPNGKLIAGYDKIKLVPFGEFTPLANYLPFLDKMVPGADFTAGSPQRSMDLENFSLVPSICFEGIFPEFIAGSITKKAGFLVNITNDAWFGNSSGPQQHLFNTRMRAIENRCYLLRCANTGISAIINPDGRIINQLPLGKRGKLEAIIYPSTSTTFYARHPHLLILLLTVTAAGIKIHDRLKNRS